ncbi:type VI secretion system lipoprotein TssJ [Ideonella sp. YS5]|uniref:type VI secretion system lipoprotein TssJ n=1 Tax=Ideonella sp. YS5 TaxID=3453714 RepID=UPI003EED5CA5
MFTAQISASRLRRPRFGRVQPGVWVLPSKGGWRSSTLRLFPLLALGCLAGCGSTSSGGTLDSALGMVGLQRPSMAVPEGVPKRPDQSSRKVTIRLHAGDVLNVTPDGRSLSIVARLYKLRDRTAFEQLSYEMLQDPKGPAPQGEWMRDVVETKEIILTPGQKFESVETVPPEAAYVAVVASFRAPAPQRWRFIFETKQAAQTGLTMGLHACALSVAAGQPVGVAPETTRLAGVRCS